MLKFSTTSVDGGSLTYGETGIYPVSVENPSNEEIVLNINSTSCSCTQGSVDPNPILPNGTSTLNIKLNSLKSGRGEQTKTLRVSWFHMGTNYSEVIKLKVNVYRS